MADRDTRARPRKVSMQDGAKCGQPCYVSIFRDEGGMEDNILATGVTEKTNRGILRQNGHLIALKKLCAVHSRTDKAEDDQIEGRAFKGHWVDWYRIPVHDKQDWNVIRTVLRGHGVRYGGPFWDLTRSVARVATGSGGDAKTSIKKGQAIQRERVKLVEKQRYPQALIHALFSRTKNFMREDGTEYEVAMIDWGLLAKGETSLDTAPPDDFYGFHGDLEPKGDLDLWRRICKEWPGFKKLWDAVAYWAKQGEGWAVRARAGQVGHNGSGCLWNWVRAFDGARPKVYSIPKEPKAALGQSGPFHHDNLESWKLEARVKTGDEPSEPDKNPNWVGAMGYSDSLPKDQSMWSTQLCVWSLDTQEKGSGI